MFYLGVKIKKNSANEFRFKERTVISCHVTHTTVHLFVCLFQMVLVQVNPGETFTVRTDDGQIQCITGEHVPVYTPSHAHQCVSRLSQWYLTDSTFCVCVQVLRRCPWCPLMAPCHPFLCLQVTYLRYTVAIFIMIYYALFYN